MFLRFVLSEHIIKPLRLIGMRADSATNMTIFLAQIPTLGKGNYADVKVFMLGKNRSLDLRDHLDTQYEFTAGDAGSQLNFMRAEVEAVDGHR